MTGTTPSAPSAPAGPAPVTGRLRLGQLRQLVAAHLVAHPGDHTPGAIARSLDRSAGAVANAISTLCARGQAELTCEKPARYRATATTATAAEAPAAAPSGPARPRRTRTRPPVTPTAPEAPTGPAAPSSSDVPDPAAPVNGPVQRPTVSTAAEAVGRSADVSRCALRAAGSPPCSTGLRVRARPP